MSEPDHIDTQSADLAHRSRTHVAAHIRAIGTQQLDALLRIEERIEAMIDELMAHLKAQGATVTRVADEIQVELPGAKPTKAKSRR